MSTSGSTDWKIVEQDLVTDICHELGIVPHNASPSTDQVMVVTRRLNYLIKHFANYGMVGFARKTKQIVASLTDATASYTLGTSSAADVSMERPIRIVGAYLRDDNGDDIPLKIITRDEYDAIPDKDDSGEPSHVYYYTTESHEDGTLYLWPVTDAATAGFALWITYHRPLEDFEGATDNPDVPQTWYQALLLNGALQCSRPFNKNPNQLLLSEAKDSLARAIGNHRVPPSQPLFGWPSDGH